MADGEENDFFSVKAIQNDVRALSELNHPFTELWRQFINWAPDLRMTGQDLHTFAHGLDRTLGGGAALWKEKIV